MRERANPTITLEERLLRRARLRALEQGTSVNALVRDYLGKLRGGDAARRGLRGSSTLLQQARRKRTRWPLVDATRCAIAPAFADTNLLLYAVGGDEPVKRRQAVATLRDEGDSVVISTQVLAEFYVVVTRKLKSPLGIVHLTHGPR